MRSAILPLIKYVNETRTLLLYTNFQSLRFVNTIQSRDFTRNQSRLATRWQGVSSLCFSWLVLIGQVSDASQFLEELPTTISVSCLAWHLLKWPVQLVDFQIGHGLIVTTGLDLNSESLSKSPECFSMKPSNQAVVASEVAVHQR